MPPNDFCALILTHGRPNRVYTHTALRRAGYTGPIYIVIDNEDDKADEYRKQFGEQNVIVFDKKDISDTFDEGDNFEDRRAIIYARNASFGIAKTLGFKTFIQLDDDYPSFFYKTDFETYAEKNILSLDDIFNALVEYFLSTPALSICMAQNGDFIGGKNSSLAQSMKPTRKAMNTFICSVDRPFTFIGRINEDVNTYTRLGSLGSLFLTIPLVAIYQMQTQSSTGGMTELYLDSGTYVKSFYSVMYSPSSVKVSEMGDANKRLHHHVSWSHTVPCILNQSVKKAT